MKMQKFRYFRVEFSKQSEKWQHLGPKFSSEVKTRILRQVKIIDDLFDMGFIFLPAQRRSFKKRNVRKAFVLFERWRRESAKKFANLRGRFKATTLILSKSEYWGVIGKKLKAGDAIVQINYGHDQDEDFEVTIRHEICHVIILSFIHKNGMNRRLRKHFLFLMENLVNFFREQNEKTLQFCVKKYGKERGTLEFVCECMARMKGL